MLYFLTSLEVRKWRGSGKVSKRTVGKVLGHVYSRKDLNLKKIGAGSVFILLLYK